MTRRDYLNDPNAPKANSIAVAVSAFVQDDQGRILMIRRTDNGYYSIPGGQVEPGETLTQAAIRETQEETGVDILITGLVGLYSNPQHVIEYDNGEVRQEFSICFSGINAGGIPHISVESSDVAWVEATAVRHLNVHPSTALRLAHALNGSGRPFFT